jgi:hypothetical protein
MDARSRNRVPYLQMVEEVTPPKRFACRAESLVFSIATAARTATQVRSLGARIQVWIRADLRYDRAGQGLTHADR